jgi:hypothetical protein
MRDPVALLIATLDAGHGLDAYFRAAEEGGVPLEVALDAIVLENGTEWAPHRAWTPPERSRGAPLRDHEGFDSSEAAAIDDPVIALLDHVGEVARAQSIVDRTTV